MKKNKLKHGLILFGVLLTMFIVTSRYFGNIDRFTTKYVEPMSWNEIYSNLPVFIIASLFIMLGIMQVIKEVKKTEARNIENARKRIEERKTIKKVKKYG